MVKRFKILMGYDDLGVVFDADNFVLRKVLPEFKKRSKKIFDYYKKFNLSKIGIVETDLALEYGDNFFKHKKHAITYPHEWTAGMFKDTALWHLDLFLNLSKYDLALKDAHPHNILFDEGKFIFVDFLSLSEQDSLKNERSLIEFAGSVKDPRFKDPRFIVFDEMFFPEFIVPLILMARQEYSKARDIICYRGRNFEAKVPCWDDLSNPEFSKKFLKEFWQNFKIKQFLNQKRKLSFCDFCVEVKNFISDLDVKPKSSVYDTYYKDKNEFFAFDFSDNWGEKQKSVYQVLKEHKPKTVLDIGANTGWFSILAAKHGAKVFATDVEESSIDLLYSYTKKNNLDIIPLLLSFQDLEKEVYGGYDSRLDFKKPRENPIFSSGINRLKSDMVLFLALFHHLVLGDGISVERIFEKLSKLTKKTLLLEYILFNDDLITKHYYNSEYKKLYYSLDFVIEKSKKYFKEVEILKSSKSRTILLFKK
ncbi:class I SAM-dependent methyltransferase [Candidatus Dependentiae bacterium]